MTNYMKLYYYKKQGVLAWEKQEIHVRPISLGKNYILLNLNWNS